MNKTVKIILGFFITVFVMMLSGAFEFGILSLFKFIPIGLASQLLILIISSGLIYFFNKNGIIDFNIKKVTIKQIIQSILVTFLVLLVAQFVFYYSIGNTNEEHIVTSLSGVSMVFMLLLASISEELLFRGFLQNMLDPLKSYGLKIMNLKLSLPVILSGILFGLIHFGIMSTGVSFNFALTIVLPAVIVGILAGFFQEKYNNFSLAIIVHITANITGFISSIITT